MENGSSIDVEVAQDAGKPPKPHTPLSSTDPFQVPSPSIHTCLHKSSCPRMGEVPTIAFPQQSTTKHWHDGACQVSNSLENHPFF